MLNEGVNMRHGQTQGVKKQYVYIYILDVQVGTEAPTFTRNTPVRIPYLDGWG